MPIKLHRFLALFLFLAGIAHAQLNTFSSLLGDEKHWTGTRWSLDEQALFAGRPEYSGPPAKTLIVRYTHFTVLYDIERRQPLWVAHFDEKESEARSRVRTKKFSPRWDRAGDDFRPDGHVIAASIEAKLKWATDASFNNANPPELPGDREKITRGHMASNMEMKCQGSEDEGDLAQGESFSLANVCPQMQGHNAPLWAKLEDQCLVWAARYKGVAVYSGPVFAPDASQPPPVHRQLRTDGGKNGATIPIPTHFYKIIIAKKAGKTVAVGFLIPHRTDLFNNSPARKKDRGLADFIVPIREIEEKTGLNFMPALGANDVVEVHANHDWDF